MPSTVVGGITDALGLALSFGFYTAMSSALSVAMPGGLAVLGGWTLHKLMKPNLEKTAAAVLHIATMRLYLQNLLAQKLRFLEVRHLRLQREGRLDEQEQRQGDTWWRRWFG